MAVLAAIVTTICLVIVQNERDFIPYWARYNYTGYESGTTADFTAKSWPEYRAFLDTANSLAPGRMLWEGGDAIGAYGTPLALMLLPYWTHGRIQSMEGLYFEASTTTPYHFMTVATLAQTPSNPVRGLPYKNIADFDLGVKYLQLMGVRYYAAFSTVAKDKAALNPNLEPVATVPDLDGKPPSGWTIYRVKDAPTVQALRYEPVVATDMQSEPSWKCEGVPKPRGHRRPGSGVQPVGVHRGAVVLRSRRARPSAHRRRPRLVDAGAGREGASTPRSRRCPTSTSRTSAPPSRRSSSTCRAPGCRSW